LGSYQQAEQENIGKNTGVSTSSEGAEQEKREEETSGYDAELGTAESSSA